jgi:xylan 1,4-beta-xylosidase
MGHDGTNMTTYRGGNVSYWHENAPKVRTLHMRIVNDRHIITFYYSDDADHWTRHSLRSEASGYHANVMDDLVSLRPALFATGSGSVHFSHFIYRALP